MLTDYLENLLSPEEQAALSGHLSTCDGCSAYLDQLKRTIAAVRARSGSDVVDEQTEANLLELFHKWADTGGTGGNR